MGPQLIRSLGLGLNLEQEMDDGLDFEPFCIFNLAPYRLIVCTGIPRLGWEMGMPWHALQYGQWAAIPHKSSQAIGRASDREFVGAMTSYPH